MKVEYFETTHPLDEEVEARLQQETADAEPKLAELISFARELMLKSAPNDTEVTLVPLEGIEPETKEGFRPRLESILEIEKFGEDILEEAFECFGRMGPLFIGEYQRANTLEEKVTVCNMVEKIVKEMVELATHQFKEENDELHRYSPIRLSPKLIGVYPNPTLATTCLGESILVASFFAKLRLPMLHAGVVMSAQQDVLTKQSETIRHVLAQSNHPEHEIPTLLEEILNSKFLDNVIATTSHRGFHAATYAEIEEGTWIQLDPNFGSALVRGRDASKLDETYGALLVTHEDTSSTGEARIILGSDFEYFFADLAKDMGTVLPSAELVDEILSNTSSSEVISVIIEKIFLPLMPIRFTDKESNEKVKKIRSAFALAFLVAFDDDPQRYIQTSIMDVLEGYVFTDTKEGDLLESIERCKTDVAYRQRRVADLCIAPLMLILKLESNWYKFKRENPVSGGAIHGCLDLGIAQYRIGISVLSDIATFYGDELPLSTWLAYWPSDVSLAEHYRQTPTIAQRLLARQSLADVKSSNYLTYPTLEDILSS